MAKKDSKLSPMMAQYFEVKSKYPDTILFFRVGDFYEMYEQDAKRGAEVLGITLTKRNTQAGPYMAGFPHHALDTYLPKLIRAGERVAICDQLEAPKQKQQEQNTFWRYETIIVMI
jgi:DNA mismatch repair protein MutS